MKYSSIPSAQTVILQCKEKGIKNIVISPGSRNAPLIIGFSEDPFFNCYSIVDERCAAFFALGIAQQQQQAVAVVCTSGSALLNYYPAVAEAFYSDVPLVVISADRPSYKIDIGDGQTIRQDHVFERHIGYSANLKQDISHATQTIGKFAEDLIDETISIQKNQQDIQAYNDQELHKALQLTLSERTPVHINVPMEEPLYDKLSSPSIAPALFPEDTTPEDMPVISNEFVDIWNKSKKKMVLVGANYPNTISQHFLDVLGSDTSVLVFTETTSNLHHPNFFPSIDGIIAPLEKSNNTQQLFSELQPDVLLTFGGLIVSKKIKSFLRKFKPEHHWHVGNKKANDTFFCLSHHFKTDTNRFFEGFLARTITTDSNYYKTWASIRDAYVLKRAKYLDTIPFTDMLAFHHMLARIPRGYQLQLANSSAVRYTQLFDLDPSLRVFCNRGTSGIDGSTSTAVGASVHSESPTIFITGDLSFYYDSNALWNQYIRPDFRIILINNNGGGIFRILPGKEETQNFESFFETTHQYSAQDLCKMHGFDYNRVGDTNGLKDALSHFYEKSERPKLLEIDTPRLINDKILLDYFDFLT
ncbi:2-succinyl-5-enolpyruvyl-6-hydroxy-3-cyclohexene-1-carboxylic-acid synthase [Spongiimicrobium sp. 3-5]|uniref:2-succinyl-5-enolpyruvyl-6-hydroxy-3- cyclohexene-1-carboxylic-acid synthase n=1 Tax=Spongiimicrobium sp. 3-5 TaxID=3332596 RepID=UPI003980455B